MTHFLKENKEKKNKIKHRLLMARLNPLKINIFLSHVLQSDFNYHIKRWKR